MRNLFEFLRTLLIYTGLAAGLAVLRWFITTPTVRQALGGNTGQLAWPALLVVAAVVGFRVLRVGKEPLVAPVRAVGGIACVIGLVIVKAALSGQMVAIPQASLYMGLILGEELFFRWIGLESLRKKEELVYSDAYLRRLAPLSLVSLTVLYGLVQGLTPATTAVNLHAAGLGQFIFLNLLYLLTGSIWPTAVAHLFL